MLIYKFITNQCNFAYSFWYNDIYIQVFYIRYTTQIFKTFVLILSCKGLSSHNINIHTHINNIFLSTH